MEAGQTVQDIMRAHPKTLPLTATVADLRHTFANPNVMTALIVDDEGALAGVVERAAVADSVLAGEAPIAGLMRKEVDAIDVHAPADAVWEHDDLARTGRLVVLEPDGRTLAGLVCARKDGSGFCL